ncbi:energy-coupling factor transporter transmembrane protein EcfT [Rhodococcus sp. WS4]|nr:energy-coupling factor transporter transmembrane protein EcfT [Rhodococcus sp. WS4]
MPAIDFTTQAAKRTWLTALDPRAKLCVLVVAVALSTVFYDPRWLFAFFLATLPMWFFSKVDVRALAKPLLGLLAVLATILIGSQIFFALGASSKGGEIIAEIGPWMIYDRNLTIGLIQFFRLGVPMSVALLLFLTTDPTMLARALRRLRVPHEATFLLIAAVRFFPMFLIESHNIMQAQLVRGLDTRGIRGLFRKVRWLIFPVIVTTLRKARTIGLAVETKGFGARATQAYYRDVRYRTADYVITIGGVIVLVAGLYARFGLGYGDVGFMVT